MKHLRQRVISSMVGLGILAVAVVFFGTYFFNLAIAALSVLAVQELLNATGATGTPAAPEEGRFWPIYRRGYRDFAAIAVVFSLTFPFAHEAMFWSRMPQIAFGLFLIFFLLVIKNHSVVRFEQASMVFLFCILIPLCFSCAIYMRNDLGDARGRYYLLMALAAAWLADTGAYFVGGKLGRRRLAPVISPKKSVEGLIGGILTATLLHIPVTFAYIYFAGRLGVPMSADYTKILIIMPLFAIIGVLGDLSMSAIKRQFGVKDYGSIMPGHGGVLDRFDSVLFTLPAVYVLIQYFPVVFLN